MPHQAKYNPVAERKCKSALPLFFYKYRIVSYLLFLRIKIRV